MSDNQPCPECRHVFPSGKRCHAIALRGKPLCYFHSRTRNVIEQNRMRYSSIALPPLEDRGAIQIAIDEVVAAHAAGKLDRRAVWPYLCAIQMASRNLAQAKDKVISDETVEEFEGHFGESLATTALESEPAVNSDPTPETPPQPAADSIKYSDLCLPSIDASATHECDPEPEIPCVPPPHQKLSPAHRRAGFSSRNEANQFFKAEYKWLENFHAARAGTQG